VLFEPGLAIEQNISVMDFNPFNSADNKQRLIG
jgi:hypothetical protein